MLIRRRKCSFVNVEAWQCPEINTVRERILTRKSMGAESPDPFATLLSMINADHRAGRLSLPALRPVYEPMTGCGRGVVKVRGTESDPDFSNFRVRVNLYPCSA